MTTDQTGSRDFEWWRAELVTERSRIRVPAGAAGEQTLSPVTQTRQLNKNRTATVTQQTTHSPALMFRIRIRIRQFRSAGRVINIHCVLARFRVTRLTLGKFRPTKLSARAIFHGSIVLRGRCSLNGGFVARTVLASRGRSPGQFRTTLPYHYGGRGHYEKDEYGRYSSDNGWVL